MDDDVSSLWEELRPRRPKPEGPILLELFGSCSEEIRRAVLADLLGVRSDTSSFQDFIDSCNQEIRRLLLPPEEGPQKLRVSRAVAMREDTFGAAPK